MAVVPVSWAPSTQDKLSVAKMTVEIIFLATLKGVSGCVWEGRMISAGNLIPLDK